MFLSVGIDEVGRGCWAGPLVAAAVLLPKPIEGLTDSKLLSKARRTELAKTIRQTALCGIGWVSPAMVDRLGLTAATGRAMALALKQIITPYSEIIIDGNQNYLAHIHVTGSTFHISRVKTLVNADKLVPEVSAASILAKVARDAYMTEQAQLFPGYEFEKHVGYGTAKHSEALKRLGLCDLHRKSYKPIKAFLV